MSTTSETNTSQPFITKKDLKELQEHVKINARKIVLMRKMVEDNRQWIRNLIGGYSRVTNIAFQYLFWLN
jgi:hypothetical protein